ncbi:hypothetical protein MKZ38_002047 [Zalerion maritima]|uniref:Uncharacterized protein n=1 Tax=Zalerion maritima TaxID=339359 RepID=A0AAD5WUV6_9PEZI|nr:hypothetical protein MKZ38_002047 [Zalerion maritima]
MPPVKRRKGPGRRLSPIITHSSRSPPSLLYPKPRPTAPRLRRHVPSFLKESLELIGEMEVDIKATRTIVAMLDLSRENRKRGRLGGRMEREYAVQKEKLGRLEVEQGAVEAGMWAQVGSGSGGALRDDMGTGRYREGEEAEEGEEVEGRVPDTASGKWSLAAEYPESRVGDADDNELLKKQRGGVDMSSSDWGSELSFGTGKEAGDDGDEEDWDVAEARGIPAPNPKKGDRMEDWVVDVFSRFTNARTPSLPSNYADVDGREQGKDLDELDDLGLAENADLYQTDLEKPQTWSFHRLERGADADESATAVVSPRRPYKKPEVSSEEQQLWLENIGWIQQQQSQYNAKTHLDGGHEEENSPSAQLFAEIDAAAERLLASRPSEEEQEQGQEPGYGVHEKEQEKSPSPEAVRINTPPWYNNDGGEEVMGDGASSQPQLTPSLARADTPSRYFGEQQQQEAQQEGPQTLPQSVRVKTSPRYKNPAVESVPESPEAEWAIQDPQNVRGKQNQEASPQQQYPIRVNTPPEYLGTNPEIVVEDYSGPDGELELASVEAEVEETVQDEQQEQEQKQEQGEEQGQDEEHGGQAQKQDAEEEEADQGGDIEYDQPWEVEFAMGMYDSDYDWDAEDDREDNGKCSDDYEEEEEGVGVGNENNTVVQNDLGVPGPSGQGPPQYDIIVISSDEEEEEEDEAVEYEGGGGQGGGGDGSDVHEEHEDDEVQEEEPEGMGNEDDGGEQHPPELISSPGPSEPKLPAFQNEPAEQNLEARLDPEESEESKVEYDQSWKAEFAMGIYNSDYNWDVVEDEADQGGDIEYDQPWEAEFAMGIYNSDYDWDAENDRDDNEDEEPAPTPAVPAAQAAPIPAPSLPSLGSSDGEDPGDENGRGGGGRSEPSPSTPSDAGFGGGNEGAEGDQDDEGHENHELPSPTPSEQEEPEDRDDNDNVVVDGGEEEAEEEEEIEHGQPRETEFLKRLHNGVYDWDVESDEDDDSPSLPASPYFLATPLKSSVRGKKRDLSGGMSQKDASNGYLTSRSGPRPKSSRPGLSQKPKAATPPLPPTPASAVNRGRDRSPKRKRDESPSRSTPSPLPIRQDAIPYLPSGRAPWELVRKGPATRSSKKRKLEVPPAYPDSDVDAGHGSEPAEPQLPKPRPKPIGRTSRSSGRARRVATPEAESEGEKKPRRKRMKRDWNAHIPGPVRRSPRIMERLEREWTQERIAEGGRRHRVQAALGQGQGQGQGHGHGSDSGSAPPAANGSSSGSARGRRGKRGGGGSANASASASASSIATRPRSGAISRWEGRGGGARKRQATTRFVSLNTNVSPVGPPSSYTDTGTPRPSIDTGSSRTAGVGKGPESLWEESSAEEEGEEADPSAVTVTATTNAAAKARARIQKRIRTRASSRLAERRSAAAATADDFNSGPAGEIQTRFDDMIGMQLRLSNVLGTERIAREMMGKFAGEMEEKKRGREGSLRGRNVFRGTN